MSRRCCVLGCSTNENSTNDVWLYTFPDDQQLYNLWMKQIGLQSVDSQSRDYTKTICNAHFDASCFESSKGMTS